MAITEPDRTTAYPGQVRWTIDQHDPRSWRHAALQLNKAPVDLVCIQHEFGIFGRFEPDGHFTDYLAGFLERLTKPVVTTLHTVLPHPPPDLRQAIRRLHAHSSAVVTMVHQAHRILAQDYNLSTQTLHTIPHGVPEAPWVPPARAKKALGLEQYTILSTFGLLSRGKGIEYAIRALPDVLQRHPEVLYLVLGATHPEIRRREGEGYRQMLLDLVEELHLEQSVRFVNRYLTQQELVSYLQATDIYLTPYSQQNQITSGTLAYALGRGKVAVSTPYLYAQEALSEGRGLLAEFANPASFSRCINLLLENASMRAQCERGALAYGRRMGWSAVGAHYARLFGQVAGWDSLASQVKNSN
jgi:glycosyltransferase involved in cell wall biosynthesis